MLHDSHQRRLIIYRCWLIYDLITKKFRPLHEFHIEFPSLAEIAVSQFHPRPPRKRERCGQVETEKRRIILILSRLPVGQNDCSGVNPV